MSILGPSEYPPGSARHCARVYRDGSPRATRPLVAASVNRPGVSHCLKPLRLGPCSYAVWLFCTTYRQDCLNLISQPVCFHFKTFVLKWKSITLLCLSPPQKTKRLRTRTRFLLIDFSDFTVNSWCKPHACSSHSKHHIDPHRPLIQGCCLHPITTAVVNPWTFDPRFKGSSAHSRSAHLSQ